MDKHFCENPPQSPRIEYEKRKNLHGFFGKVKAPKINQRLMEIDDDLGDFGAHLDCPPLCTVAVWARGGIISIRDEKAR